MTQKLPDAQTLQQLEVNGYLQNGNGAKSDRPLLVCDVDEVVLHLVDPFVAVLEERGFTLKSHSFKLTGNVFDAKTGREATQEEVWAGLTQLFEEQQGRQGLVDGVVDGLQGLSPDVDILFLTNMPHAFGDVRRQHLTSSNLDFPLVTNVGSKVPAIHIIRQHRSAPVGFIDDTPKNLEQVAASLTDIHLFHFMANDTFRRMVDPIEGAHFSTGSWTEAQAGIHKVLVENGS